MEHQLLELFTSDNSRYLKSSLTGEDDERGKKQAHYATVHEPVTASVWKKHLSGEIRLGLKPEINGECKWACIDVDPNNYKDYSEKKYVEIIKKYSLRMQAELQTLFFIEQVEMLLDLSMQITHLFLTLLVIQILKLEIQVIQLYLE